MSKKNIRLHFGALADSIDAQFKTQGFRFNARKVEAFQASHDALITLQFACLITDSARLKIQDKLYKRVVQHICECNKLKEVKMK